jgi:hypothetical protein
MTDKKEMPDEIIAGYSQGYSMWRKLDNDYLILEGEARYIRVDVAQQSVAGLVEALRWALDVIETCEKNAHNIDWSIGHFGRKGRAQQALREWEGT